MSAGFSVNISGGRKSIHESIISLRVDMGLLQKLTGGIIIMELGVHNSKVTKRFSEFDVLLQNLTQARYAGLPNLPSDTRNFSSNESMTTPEL